MVTTAILEKTDSLSEWAEPRLRRWSVAEFRKMSDAGIWGSEEHLELIGGQIVQKMPPSPPHSVCVDLTRLVLSRVFAGMDMYLRTENPIALPGDYHSEPDIAVVIGNPRRYADQFPEPEEIFLLVEVAGTALEYDREVKGEVYAAAGIPEYWIINLRERQVEVFRRPAAGAWSESFLVSAEGSLSPLAAPEAMIPVVEILP
ncbi:MAG: Uma2 family endonuclease [Armatimonadaceae bacterium]